MKQKLHDMAYRSDSLQHVQCQLAMLTSTVNNLVLVLSRPDAVPRMSTMPYGMCSSMCSPTLEHHAHLPDSAVAEHGAESETFSKDLQ
jgi:UDP-N-acetyl-D-mannosaminuronate dehydrogenase